MYGFGGSGATLRPPLPAAPGHRVHAGRAVPPMSVPVSPCLVFLSIPFDAQRTGCSYDGDIEGMAPAHEKGDQPPLGHVWREGRQLRSAAQGKLVGPRRVASRVLQGSFGGGPIDAAGP